MLVNIINKVVQYNNPNIDFQLQSAQNVDQLSANHKKIVNEVLKLYQCKPEESTFDLYHSNAVFEDPICNAINRVEIRSQFLMMPKVFSKSVTTQVQVLYSDQYEITLDLFQWYHVALIGFKIPVRSLVRLVLNYEDKIIYHGDLWYHSVAFDRASGISGFIWKSLRRLNCAGMVYVERFLNKKSSKRITS